MGKVRAIERGDVPQIADLSIEVFGTGAQPASLRLQSFFEQLLFQNPWVGESLPSLVYQDSDGSIAGFLGVMPRRLSIDGTPIRTAVGHTFMVAPQKRGLAGIQLLKEFFSGPQDLTWSDPSNDASRLVWERLGGTAATLYSIHWIRHLRPVKYFVEKRKALPSYIRPLVNPLTTVADAVATGFPSSPFYLPTSSPVGGDLGIEPFLKCQKKYLNGGQLRPEYDCDGLRWIMEILEETGKVNRDIGTLQSVLVRDVGGNIIGWYIYFLNRTGISRVLNIGADEHTISDVLDHLFSHAKQNGAVALQGKIVPQFMRQFMKKCDKFYVGDPWTLCHSKNSELVSAVIRGEAWLSTLEGECWRWLQSALN